MSEEMAAAEAESSGGGGAGLDSGFQCLVLVAMLHHMEIDESRLWHEYNVNGRMDWVQLVRAAKDAGFKAKLGK